jgi:hypothetical protein
LRKVKIVFKHRSIALAKSCAKSGIATFSGSAATEMLRSNQILGELGVDSRVQLPFRDFFNPPARENVAQTVESRGFVVHRWLKSRERSRF